MSRFDQEWALVPAAARWLAGFAALAFAVVMAAVFLLPAFGSGDPKALYVLGGMFLLTLLGAFPIALYVLLIGYVFGDARRRGMNALLWTLLAVFIPSAVGVILYFILRDPVPFACPSCGMLARKGHAFCASCGAGVRPACAQCRQPIEPNVAELPELRRRAGPRRSAASAGLIDRRPDCRGRVASHARLPRGFPELRPPGGLVAFPARQPAPTG